MARTTIKGLDRVKANLARIGESMENDAAVRAVTSGIELYRLGLQRRAPRDTGRLVGGMTATVKLDRRRGVLGKTGPARRQFYAFFLEFGTAKASARPFMRTTLDEDAAEVARVMALEYRVAVLDALGRLSTK